jgi:hypothetical protein
MREGRSVTHIVENWSRIVGQVEALDPPAQPGGAGTLTVRVERVDDIAGPAGSPYPNLLAGTEGRTLRVQIPAATASQLDFTEASSIALDIRRGRTADRLFARPPSIT